MKTIILAGGLGTRIAEETENKPKPMVLIDGHPILWHLMNIFDVQGFSDFVLALGYRGDVIKRWLVDLNDLGGDFTINTRNKELTRRHNYSENNWEVTALETGLRTQTGGRIKKCMQEFPDERVLVTYGDGLGNVNIPKLIQFHKEQGRLATVTAVRPPARFGQLEFSEGQVLKFGEKNQSDAGWINGGFFVLEPEVASFIHDETEPFETGALPRLVELGQLSAFQHEGFWQPMDTLREKLELENFARMPTPPWLKDLVG